MAQDINHRCELEQLSDNQLISRITSYSNIMNVTGNAKNYYTNRQDMAKQILKEREEHRKETSMLKNKIGELEFTDVSTKWNKSEGGWQFAHHGWYGSITVLQRMTGFGHFDVETGFRDVDGEFWLASGNFSIRSFPELTVSEAINKIKENANTCVGKELTK